MKICTHTIVKNEERYIWFALSSCVDFVDTMYICDTGSSDKTLQIVEEFQKRHSDKVRVERHRADTPQEIKKARQKMLEDTKEDWIIILDGDEVWWKDSISVLTKTIKKYANKLDSVVVPFVNVIGDIFHYQDPQKGKYEIDNKKGFLTIRAINRNISGLHVDKGYPLEGYYDTHSTLIQDLPRKRRLHLDTPYLHFSHLVRSLSLKFDEKTTARKGKNKVELGKSFPLDYYYPEVFFDSRPDIVPNPWNNMKLKYLLMANFLQPFKQLKLWIK